jgi:hypothetical protein
MLKKNQARTRTVDASGRIDLQQGKLDDIKSKSGLAYRAKSWKTIMCARVLRMQRDPAERQVRQDKRKAAWRTVDVEGQQDLPTY